MSDSSFGQSDLQELVLGYVSVTRKGGVNGFEPKPKPEPGECAMPARSYHLPLGTCIVWRQRFPKALDDDGRPIERELGLVNVTAELCAFVSQLGGNATWEQLRDEGFGLPMPK